MIKRFNVQHQKWLVYRKRAHRRAPIRLLFHYSTTSWREGRDEYARTQTQRTTHHHFLFTAATQSNTRQSFATKSVVNKRVNAFIEASRQRNIRNATQYCPQTVDRGLCSVRSLVDHVEQCLVIKSTNPTCCGCNPYESK